MDLAAIDRSADACNDFFQFTCGGWLASHELPADRTNFGSFVEVLDRNFEILRGILEAPAPTGALKKAVDYYDACMAESVIEAKGLAPLRPELTRIDALAAREALPTLLARLHDFTTAQPQPGVLQLASTPLFVFGAAQDRKDATQNIAQIRGGVGFAIADREVYLKSDARSVSMRDTYVAHIRQMFELAGQSSAEAAEGSRAVMAIETALARASLDAVERRNPNNTYHAMSLAELQQLTPSFNWTAYLAASSVPKPARLNVMQPAFMTSVNEVIRDTPLSELKRIIPLAAPARPRALPPEAVPRS